jgi:hypothetical protein
MQQPAIRITGPLKSRINRLAHARAQRFALDEQARLIAELQELAATGASHDDLHAHLDAIEQEAVL